MELIDKNYYIDPNSGAVIFPKSEESLEIMTLKATIEEMQKEINILKETVNTLLTREHK